MSATRSTQTANGPNTRDPIRAARYFFGGWRGVLILAAIAVAAGLALNWSWLVAAGIAPALLTAWPCLVMCGAGLCMNKLLGGGSSDSAPGKPNQTISPE
jgi:hypothetical protein